MPITYTIPKYNSQTGEGTLSNISRSFGVSMDDIMGANQGNPAIKNKDLIYAGGQITIPGSQVQQSTASLRNEVEKRNAEFDQKQAEYQMNQDAQAATETTTTDEKTKEDGVKDNLDTSDAEKAYMDAAKTDIERYTQDYDRVQARLDKAHRDLVGGIKTTFAARIQKMEDSNDRLLKLKEALGIRQGRSRYAPILQAGILTDEEMQGHERVMELEGQMLQAIAEADSAKATGDYQRLNDLYDRIDKRNEEMNNQIQTNFDNAVKRNKEIEAALKAERDEVEAQWNRALDKSERVAPAVAAALGDFSTEEEKNTFLKTYAEKTGIPLDVLMGDVQKSQTDSTKDALDIEKKKADIANVNNTMYNRNRNTDSLIASRDNNTDLTDVTANIIDGISSIDDVDEGDLETVKAELRSLGFYSSTVPQWFLEAKQAEQGGTQDLNPSQVQADWDKERTRITG